MSTLRNANVACLCLLIFALSHVKFKKSLLGEMSKFFTDSCRNWQLSNVAVSNAKSGQSALSISKVDSYLALTGAMLESAGYCLTCLTEQ